ncbi:hypothetical protein NYP18_05305 [Corynebacterium sp. YIM 101645]|uniref:Secreted protein n=1 Tax=Corynebacterium lemuris TaxID=1859292 RepID=A0ABT2FV02_9CORY|nr:hypothetical protein [Corynebacterium lemuris]MCS5479072.1 hypothetical protein [Corynebacterium lemuris]
MKLSRKALAAVATTFALTTAGISAPAMAAPTPTITILAEEAGDDKGDEKNEDTSSGSSTSDNKDKDGEDVDGGSSDPKDIRDWVAVFTAVVGALSTAFVFIQKLNG